MYDESIPVDVVDPAPMEVVDPAAVVSSDDVSVVELETIELDCEGDAPFDDGPVLLDEAKASEDDVKGSRVEVVDVPAPLELVVDNETAAPLDTDWEPLLERRGLDEELPATLVAESV